MSNENTPAPADPHGDMPGEPNAGDLPSPVGQQPAEDDGDPTARAADAVRRVENDPRT